MKTYKERTESIIRKAELQRQQKRKKIKLISSVACACVCAVTLCISLPIALSDSANGTALPPQVDTGTSDNKKPTIPPETKPPITDSQTPPSADSPYIEVGFVSSGMSEPVSTLMIAYRIDRKFDADGDISVQLSFGEYRHNYDNSLGLTRVVISVYNHDGDQTYVLKELTAEQFLIPEYDVKIKYTIEENERGEQVTTAETKTFSHQEVFTFPNSMLSKDKGTLGFNIFAYDGDKYLSGSGAQFYYAKSDGKINIITYSEYKELDQTNPPKTDITVTPSK